jgi:bis(5'-nucleosyl)-tetraphosphatase (symmetrical)
MARYAIGDVQGCFAALEALLAKIGFDRTRDRLWFVGDLVNRGPQSLEVLRFVRSLGEQAVTVLGNHDLHLIAVESGHAKPHRGDTLDPVLNAPDRAELLQWLRSRRLAYLEDGFLLVHAGLLPQWSGADTVRLAGEVEAVLASPRFGSFVSRMYGDHPDRWDDALAGVDRLRAIVNAMTRMRFCNEQGFMELREKGGPERTPRGFLPWFDIAARRTAELTIVCGHWSTLGFVERPGLVALDSGCVWGGCLTAVRLEDRQVFQVSCEQQAAPALPASRAR